MAIYITNLWTGLMFMRGTPQGWSFLHLSRWLITHVSLLVTRGQKQLVVPKLIINTQFFIEIVMQAHYTHAVKPLFNIICWTWVLFRLSIAEDLKAAYISTYKFSGKNFHTIPSVHVFDLGIWFSTNSLKCLSLCVKWYVFLCSDVCIILLFCYPFAWFVSSCRTDHDLVITIQDTSGFVRAEDVSSLLAPFNTSYATFLPAQRYGK